MPLTCENVRSHRVSVTIYAVAPGVRIRVKDSGQSTKSKGTQPALNKTTTKAA